MRAALLAIALLLAVPAAADATPPAGWSPDVAAARAYAGDRAGVVSFHVRTDRRQWSFHAGRSYPSASVVKAMLLIAYLDRPDIRARRLRASDHALLDPMIRRSDNPTADRVFAIVGQDGLAEVAQRAGMTEFATDPSWLLTHITARDQTRLWIRFERFLPRRHRRAGMKLLRTIAPPHRWGVGEVPLPTGWKLYFKGGWASGMGLVNHQVALLRRGRERVALAILTARDPSHAYGTETVRGVAERLLRGLPG